MMPYGKQRKSIGCLLINDANIFIYVCFPEIRSESILPSVYSPKRGKMATRYFPTLSAVSRYPCKVNIAAR